MRPCCPVEPQYLSEDGLQACDPPKVSEAEVAPLLPGDWGACSSPAKGGKWGAPCGGQQHVPTPAPTALQGVRLRPPKAHSALPQVA